MDNKKIAALEAKIQNDYANIAGITVYQHGELLYEYYQNGCDQDTHIHIFSITKSVMSILIGIAIDKGFIKSIDQKVLDFFPNYEIKKREKTIQAVTFRNLLTMTAPYKFKFNPYTKFFKSDDWVKASLDSLGGKKAIGKFRYAPVIGPDILSGILMNSTKQSVFDFAKENLFGPLDITVEKNITFETKEDQMEFYKSTSTNGWVSDPKGVNTAGWGLTLTTKDLAKLGQLYLNGGVWEGKQIVSKTWVEESTSPQSHWDKLNLDYGYLWWVLDQKDHCFAALGDGGNALYVNEENQMVISITSLFVPRVKDRVDFIKEDIEPVFLNSNE